MIRKTTVSTVCSSKSSIDPAAQQLRLTSLLAGLCCQQCDPRIGLLPGDARSSVFQHRSLSQRKRCADPAGAALLGSLYGISRLEPDKQAARKAKDAVVHGFASSS